MKNFATCIWLDHQAEELFAFYQSVFKNTKQLRSTKYSDASASMSGQPKGSLMTLEFEIEGQEFVALNGGPIFKLNPSVSFYVSCDSVAEVDELYGKLADGGTPLMPLNKYPFSERFGWLTDKFGVSWCMNFAPKDKQKIAPQLMFANELEGKAEEAVNLYTSIFKNSKIVQLNRFAEGEGGTVGNIKHGIFELDGEEFRILDAPGAHAFNFNEAVSFIINCKTQAEVDNFWSKLCDGGTPSQCGWLKDKFGVSWQVVPQALTDMLLKDDPERCEKMLNAMRHMSKLDIAALEAAYSS